MTSESKPSGTTAYRYDVTSRMVGIDADNDGTDETTYAYNDQGVRISQTDVATSTTTTYLIDPNNPTGYAKQIEELVNGTLTRSFTLGLMIHGQHDAATGAVALLHDGHGSTRLLTNASQAIIESYTYTAFGDALGFTANTAATAWLFANDGIYDKASGLTYHLARYRSGHVFTQTDPFTGFDDNPLSLHKRMYAHANPVMLHDANGMFAIGLGGFNANIAGVFALSALGIAWAVLPTQSRADATTYWPRSTGHRRWREVMGSSAGTTISSPSFSYY